MIKSMRTFAGEQHPCVDSAMGGNEDVFGYNIFTSRSLQTPYLPGVVDLDLFARNHYVNRWTPCLRIGASQHHPMGMIDAATELPAAFDPVSSIYGMRSAFPGERSRD